MNVIVTGGAGFVGSNLALALEQKGARVLVIDDFSSGDFHNLAEFRGDVIAQDLNEVAWDRLDRVDAVFHQAAITDTTSRDQKRMIATNVEGMRKALEFALRHKARFIYASSAAVYGSLGAPQHETMTPSPLNVYAFSKVIGDELARRAWSESKAPVIGLRYFNVYGLREQYKGSAASMIYRLAEQIRHGKRPRIFMDGEQMRDHIYVKDVVAANLKALEARGNGIVNLGTGKPTSFNRIIEVLNEGLGTNLAPDYFENPYEFYQNKTQADTTELKRLLGFETRFSIEEGIRDYLTTLYQLSPKAPISIAKLRHF